MKQGYLSVNLHRCVACHSCELSCSIAHSISKDLIGMLSEEKKPHPRIRVEFHAGHSSPIQCRHCADAPCASVCPVDAISRSDNGTPVLLDLEKCIGCRSCVVACPYGIMEMDPSTLSQKKKKVLPKCDLCLERLEQDEIPACASSCPTEAIRFVESGAGLDHLVYYGNGAVPEKRVPTDWL